MMLNINLDLHADYIPLETDVESARTNVEMCILHLSDHQFDDNGADIISQRRAIANEYRYILCINMIVGQRSVDV
jgi:hypothetical protein